MNVNICGGFLEVPPPTRNLLLRTAAVRAEGHIHRDVCTLAHAEGRALQEHMKSVLLPTFLCWPLGVTGVVNCLGAQ